MIKIRNLLTGEVMFKTNWNDTIGKDFSGYNLNWANFSGLDLSNSNFTGCQLIQTDFSNCDLNNVDFTSSTLKNTDFSNAKNLITIKNNKGKPGSFYFVSSVIDQVILKLKFNQLLYISVDSKSDWYGYRTYEDSKCQENSHFLFRATHNIGNQHNKRNLIYHWKEFIDKIQKIEEGKIHFKNTLDTVIDSNIFKECFENDFNKAVKKRFKEKLYSRSKIHTQEDFVFGGEKCFIKFGDEPDSKEYSNDHIASVNGMTDIKLVLNLRKGK